MSDPVGFGQEGTLLDHLISGMKAQSGGLAKVALVATVVFNTIYVHLLLQLNFVQIYASS